MDPRPQLGGPTASVLGRQKARTGRRRFFGCWPGKACRCFAADDRPNPVAGVRRNQAPRDAIARRTRVQVWMLATVSRVGWRRHPKSSRPSIAQVGETYADRSDRGRMSHVASESCAGATAYTPISISHLSSTGVTFTSRRSSPSTNFSPAPSGTSRWPSKTARRVPPNIAGSGKREAGRPALGPRCGRCVCQAARAAVAGAAVVADLVLFRRVPGANERRCFRRPASV